MTIPAGAGSSSAGSQQQTHVPDDAEEGLPAATGNSAAGGAPSGEIQAGGPASDALKDEPASPEDAASPAGSGSVGQGAEAGPAVGDSDPSGI